MYQSVMAGGMQPPPLQRAPPPAEAKIQDLPQGNQCDFALKAKDCVKIIEDLLFFGINDLTELNCINSLVPLNANLPY